MVDPNHATLDALARAFPRALRGQALIAAAALADRIDRPGRIRTTEVLLEGEALDIPRHLRFGGEARPERVDGDADLMVRCLLTRSADGHERQHAARAIALRPRAWTVPFLLLLAADHVAAVAQTAAEALPRLDTAAVAAMVQENRPLLRRLRADAARHWEQRFRATSPRSGSPGLAMLHAFERWAAA